MNTSTKVPFLDLKAQHAPLKSELMGVFSEAIDDAAFVGGAVLTSFEKEFSDLCNTRHAVGVSNGTDALTLALKAVGVGAGETVVTVPNTFFATTEAITHAGANIEFVDVHPKTKLMDPERLAEHMERRQPTSNVAAIIPVHLYGQMADMDPIQNIADKYDVKIVEDSAQAHGAEYKGRRAGSFGSAACFSFYAGKNLGACGEAGAVCTNDDEIANTLKILREHGQEKKHVYKLEGYNSRMDSIQAGFLKVKLPHLLDWNERRRAIASQYDAAFQPLAGIEPVAIDPNCLSARHLYIVHSRNRDALAIFLEKHDIASGLHYPEPLHLMPVYSRLGHKKGDFPNAEKSASQLLSLPIYPEMSQQQIDHVIDTVVSWAKTEGNG